MSVLSPSRRTSTRLALAAGAAAVVALAPQAAFAATVSVSPSTAIVSGSSVTVSGSGYVANGSYKVGVCSKKTYGIFGIPACASGVDATTDASGNLSIAVVASKTNTNAHASIPVVGAGQPSSFTCKGASNLDQCEIVITDHNGSSSTIVARQNISFS
ncbi:neocarzinostatin apoprotein domain-containing protein [Aeromicrobium fastidiosum]|uniref:IPT/TIG domain-containing protein n=1 Tax=Aeromicrobium fastidiosum TaxID=52699 RepID=A0A641ASE6_9ACTN|nr:neocarzinostatin apoprotein domain-containing protein [Aeromicrobium fastidiosum]KAA1380153.1 hypothetical protein ESP62_002820 [Aeromicrobium fastidiosum]MBP2389688.1 putative RecA/RadA family phage recombinase [Aeromicrobium fastidiosum]